MGRIGAVVVLKDDVLLVLAALNDLGGTGGKLVLDLLQHRKDKRRDNLEHEERQLLLELLENLGQDGHLRDLLGQVLEQLVVELDGRHDLAEHLAHVVGQLLGFLGRNGQVLHLGRLGVLLQLVDLVLIGLAAEDAVGDLVEELAQKAGVRLLAVDEGAFEVRELALDHLVRDYGSLDDIFSTVVKGTNSGRIWHTFTRDRVQEVNTTKGAGDEGIDTLAGTRDPKLGIAADVREDIPLAQLDEGQLSVVAVSEEV